MPTNTLTIAHPHSCFPTVTVILFMLAASSFAVAGELRDAGPCLVVQGDWSPSRVGNIIEIEKSPVGKGQHWNGSQNGCLLTVTLTDKTKVMAYCPDRLAGSRFQITIIYQVPEKPVVYWLEEGDKCTISSTVAHTVDKISAYRIQ